MLLRRHFQALSASIALAACVSQPDVGADDASAPDTQPSAYEVRRANGEEVRAKNAAVASAIPAFVNACVAGLSGDAALASEILAASGFTLNQQRGGVATYRNSEKPLDSFGSNAIEVAIHAVGADDRCSLAFYRGDSGLVGPKIGSALQKLKFREGKVERDTRSKTVFSYIRNDMELSYRIALRPGQPNTFTLVREP